MTRSALAVAASALGVAATVLAAQDNRDAQPAGDRAGDAGTVVRVDALVTDKKDRAVPGLTRDEFAVRLGDLPLAIATFEALCPLGPAPDPQPLQAGATLPAPIGPGIPRRIVLVLDYHNLSRPMRPQILKAADSMLQFAKTDVEEVMIVALAAGVRIEQRFTPDLRQLRATLTRMAHDSSLWARDFPLDPTGADYFAELTTLFDVLDAYDGSKAVVLFSQLRTFEGGKRDLDARYDAVARHAAAARTAVYPANPDLLDMDADGGSAALARFADATGGRMPRFTNDVSLPYRQAQRDLSCRYTLGVDLATAPVDGPDALMVQATRRKLRTRHPERIRVFGADDLRASRARAAFLDPGPYESPLVRGWAHATLPVTESAWDTLMALNFSLPVGPGGTALNVAAEIRHGATQVMKADRDLHVGPPPGGGATRAVTVYADTTLRQGDHGLTVVLTRPDAPVVSAAVDIQVPPVIEGLLVLRGPLFARTVPGGLLVRVDPEGEPEDAKLRDLLGAAKGFEPLIVNAIAANEELLYYWNACVFGTPDLERPATVERRLLTADGAVAYALDVLPLALAPRPEHEQLACHLELERVAPGTLAPGEYTAELLVTAEGGDVVARSRAPLQVLPPAP